MHTKADTYTTHNNAIFDLRKSGLIFAVNFQFGFSNVTAFNKVKSVCAVITGINDPELKSFLNHSR